MNYNTTYTTFDLIHAFIEGFHQGLYKKDDYKLSDQCFERKAVQKFNEYAYTFVGDPFGNFFDNLFPMAAMTV